MKRNSILSRIAFFLLFTSIIAISSYAERDPIINGDLDNWGTILLQKLNVTQTENGTLKAGLNASLYNLNATRIFIANTGNFTFINVSRNLVVLGNVGIGTSAPAEALVVIGNVNISGTLNVSDFAYFGKGVNITGGLSVASLNAGSCDLKADAGGNFYCGSDATAAGGFPDTIYFVNNVTTFLGGSDINASILKIGNMSNIRESLFNLGNASKLPFSNFTKENLTSLPFSNYTGENFTAQYDARTDRFNLENGTKLSFSKYTTENLTAYLGGSDVNASILKIGNMSNIREGAFNKGNLSLAPFSNYTKENLSADLAAGIASSILTTTLTSDNIIVNKNLYVIGNISNTNIANLNINGSLYPALDNFFDFGNGTLRWRNANFTGTIQSNILTSPTITATNLYDLDSSNFFDLTGCGTGATFTAIDQTGAITCSAISITESQISDLKAYQIEAPAWKKENASTFLGDRNSSIPDVLNNLTFFGRWVGNVTKIGQLNNDANFITAAGVPAAETDAAHDECSEISGCVVGAITDGNTNWDNSYGFVVGDDAFDKSNLSEYLGGSDINASILKIGNMSNIRESLFNLGNASKLPFSNYTKENFTSQYDGRTDRWLIGNLTNYLGGSDVNASLIKIGNLSNIFLSAFNKGNYSTEYASTGFKRANVSEYLGGSDVNASILKIGNLTNIYSPLWNWANNASKVIDNSSIIIAQNITLGQNGAGKIPISGKNFTATNTNQSLGNFTIGQYNASCTGFRFGSTSGWVLACAP